jgi:hypothetical protein
LRKRKSDKCSEDRSVKKSIKKNKKSRWIEPGLGWGRWRNLIAEEAGAQGCDSPRYHSTQQESLRYRMGMSVIFFVIFCFFHSSSWAEEESIIPGKPLTLKQAWAIAVK